MLENYFGLFWENLLILGSGAFSDLKMFLVFLVDFLFVKLEKNFPDIQI